MFRLLRDVRFWLVLILFLGALLRFYRIEDYLRFLGDEGRDVLVVKQMITDQKWTLLGPTASVGGFYTGPIYYYFMLPFLWAFNLNPVGPAVMSALFGLATIVLIFYFTKLFFGSRAAVIAAFLAAISPKMIEISRFSWNPNPVPFFTLGTFLCLYLAVEKKRKIFLFVAGVFLGILYQLHYMDLVLFPVVGLISFLIFPNSTLPVSWTMIAAGFVVGNSMFLFFELRHGFPNTRTVWEFVTRGTNVAPRSSNLVWLIYERTRILFETMFNTPSQYLHIFYYGSLIALLFWVRRNTKTIILLAWLILGALGIGLYRGQIYDHYFGYLFPLPFILLGLGFQFVLKWRWGIIPFVVGMAVLVIFSLQSLFIFKPPNNLLAQTQAVDRIVLELAGVDPYNFALIAPGNSDHAYHYFLEVWGKTPVRIDPPQSDPERKTVTNQLIVVCEQQNCAPLGHPIWEIAGFGQAEIVDSKAGPAGISIYKLIHYNQTQNPKFKSQN